MMAAQDFLAGKFIDQMLSVQGGEDFFVVIALTLFAIFLFKVLVAVAEAMVVVVATTTRVVAQVLPFLLILALLLWAYGA